MSVLDLYDRLNGSVLLAWREMTSPAADSYNVYVNGVLLGNVGPPLAATPTFSPAAGTYGSVQSVTISDATPASTIYYTTDGSTPTTSSTVYTTPVPVVVSGTLKAMAIAAGFSPSAVGSAAYTISIAVPNRMGGLMSAGGGGAFAPELYPNFKNRFREGFIVAGATPDANGWPSAAYSWNAYSGSGTPTWATGTFKSGYIGTGTPTAFGPCVVDNIVLGNGTTTYTTFDLHSVTGPNFGYSNSAAANSCFNYLPSYPGTTVDDPTNPSWVTNECIALWSQLHHMRTEWTDTSMWNTQLSTSANRHTPANTQVFYQTNQWFSNQTATLGGLPLAGATTGTLSGWARGAGTWCFTFNESGSFEGRICTVGTGANPTITWNAGRGLTANVSSTSVTYGIQAYPLEWMCAIAVAANTGLEMCEATLQDGTNNVAGSYTAARLAVVQTYITNYPLWTGQIILTPGDENWNPTYGSYRVFLEASLLYGFANTQFYAATWMHALANLGRTQFPSLWGTRVVASLEWQNQNVGEFFNTLNYMATTLGLTPKNDLNFISTAAYMVPTGLSGSSTVLQIQTAVAADALTRTAVSKIENLVIMGMHYGLSFKTYEGGVAWDGISGITNLPAAVMDAGYTAPMESYYSTLENSGAQLFSHTVVGGSNLQSGGNSGDSLGNVWPPTVANTPALAALVSTASTNPVLTRNLINGSGSIIAGGNYADKTGAANPAFPSGTFSSVNGSPYYSGQGYIGWFFNCTVPGTYTLVVTCAGSGTPSTNVEIGSLSGFTIPISGHALAVGANNLGSVTIPVGPGYLLLGNGTPQSTLTISQLQFN